MSERGVSFDWSTPAVSWAATLSHGDYVGEFGTITIQQQYIIHKALCSSLEYHGSLTGYLEPLLGEWADAQNEVDGKVR